MLESTIYIVHYTITYLWIEWTAFHMHVTIVGLSKVGTSGNEDTHTSQTTKSERMQCLPC